MVDAAYDKKKLIPMFRILIFMLVFYSLSILPNAVTAICSALAAAQITMTQIAGYKFSDYLKYGWLLSLLEYLCILVFVPPVFSFGLAGGFVYRKAPRVTLKSIANGDAPLEETLCDSPEVDKTRARHRRGNPPRPRNYGAKGANEHRSHDRGSKEKALFGPVVLACGPARRGACGRASL